jgi:hypothetical protein
MAVRLVVCGAETEFWVTVAMFVRSTVYMLVEKCKVVGRLRRSKEIVVAVANYIECVVLYFCFLFSY